MADIIEKAKAEGGSAIFESQSSKVANSNDEIVNSTNPFSFTSSPASLPQTTTISGSTFLLLIASAIKNRLQHFLIFLFWFCWI